MGEFFDKIIATTELNTKRKERERLKHIENAIENIKREISRAALDGYCDIDISLPKYPEIFDWLSCEGFAFPDPKNEGFEEGDLITISWRKT